MVALGWQAGLVIGVVTVGLILMMGDWVAPHLVFSGMVGVLMAARVITEREGAAGFSSTGVLTVVFLYVVAEGVSQTGGLDRIMSRVLGTSASSKTAALIRSMLPVAIASAFFNNTPIVALMIPILVSWGRRTSISPKVLLIPLSYASIFGGTTTLIGTSTNLVISGLQAQAYAGTPNATFGFFDITPYGLPYGAWGFLYVLIFARWLLPDDTGSRPREDLLLAASIGPSSVQVVGKTLGQAGLLQLSGLVLTRVQRGQTLLYRRPLPVKLSLLAKLRGNTTKAASGTEAPLKDVEAAAGSDQGRSQGNVVGGTPSKHPERISSAPDAADSILLQGGDLLFFQGDYQQLQQHAERLGLTLLTSSLTPLADAAVPALSGPLPAAATAKLTGAAKSNKGGWLQGLVTRLRDGHTGVDAMGGDDQDGPSSFVRQPTQLRPASVLLRPGSAVGWSGASLWLFRAQLSKASPLVNQRVGDVDFWSSYGVIVVGVEAKAKARLKRNQKPADTITDVVLEPGTLLIFTARNDFDVRNTTFSSSFEQVQYLHEQRSKEYLLAMRVKEGSAAAGKDIHENGLEGINGMYIVGIDRPSTGDRLRDVPRTFVLQEGDLLWFASDLDGVKYLRKEQRLEEAQAAQVAKLKIRQKYQSLLQLSVAPDSPLIGNTARGARLRTYYDAVVIAIHRHGGLVDLKDAADVELQAGDILLLEVGEGFAAANDNNPAFGLLSQVPKSSPLKTRLMWPALVLTAVMIITQIIPGITGVNLIGLWSAAILTGGVMLLIGCLTPAQALASIDWPVYITIAFAFGLGTSMDKSGVARAIADIFVALSKAIGGQTAALASMYLVTALLSEILTNNAAAALMFPIAAQVANDLVIEPKMMSIALMLGASAAFISPFGYQCSLMVYTVGNYKTVDFVRFGTLLQAWQFVGVCVIMGLPRYWMILCAAALGIIAGSIAYAVWVSFSRKRAIKRAKAARLLPTADTPAGDNATTGSKLPAVDEAIGPKEVALV